MNEKYDVNNKELHVLLDDAYKNQRANTRSNWWHSKKVIQHVNTLICNRNLEKLNDGAYFLLREKVKEQGRKSLALALSVGCGSAEKEMRLLLENTVDFFHCFELSKERIEIAKQNAEKLKLSHRIKFHHQDFFTSPYNREDFYDLVFWDGSLHHMQDTNVAVNISYNILKKQGVFYCNDYIGASYYQWSDAELNIVNSVLANFSKDLFENPDGGYFPSKVWRPRVQQVIAADPTEAVDSIHIKPAILTRFDNVYHKDLGGLLYLLALNNILINISEEDPILDYILKLDEHTISLGLSQFAFFLAVK